MNEKNVCPKCQGKGSAEIPNSGGMKAACPVCRGHGSIGYVPAPATKPQRMPDEHQVRLKTNKQLPAATGAELTIPDTVLEKIIKYPHLFIQQPITILNADANNEVLFFLQHQEFFKIEITPEAFIVSLNGAIGKFAYEVLRLIKETKNL